MVLELMEIIDELTDKQQKFIKNLHEYLDPYAPFLDQMEGLSNGENQEKWLYAIYDYHLNDEKDAFEEAYDSGE